MPSLQVLTGAKPDGGLPVGDGGPAGRRPANRGTNGGPRVSQALAVVKDRDDLLGKILEKLLEVSPHAEQGFVLVGSTIDQLQPAHVRHRKPDAAAPMPTVSRTIAKKVFEQRRALLCQNAA